MHTDVCAAGRVWSVLGWLLVVVLGAAVAQLWAAEPAFVLEPFGDKPSFSFGTWEELTKAKLSALKAADGQGGIGFIVQKMDLSKSADCTPILYMRALPGNRAKRLRMGIAGGGQSAIEFLYDIPAAGESLVPVLPIGAGPLTGVLVDSKGMTSTFDPAKVDAFTLIGDWSKEPVAVRVGKLEFQPATPEMTKMRQEAAITREKEIAQLRKDEAARQAKIRELVAGSPHPSDGAMVENVGAVAPDILGIQIQSGVYQPGAMVPYTAQADDKLIDGEKAWVVRDGKMIEEMVGKKVVRKGVTLGAISFDGKWVLQSDRVVGTPLEQITLGVPAAYQITSPDDPAYATAVTPTAVYRKNKPDSPVGADGPLGIQFRVYLKLPSPLKEGASYTVRFKGLNTRQETIDYKHDTRVARSEAVHVTHIGYRPEDPFKRAYVSIWLGTGGGYQHENPGSFELVDAKSGNTVFTGKPVLAKAKDAPDGLFENKNTSMTAVYHLDFSTFSTPGTYRVRVPGIGASYPFQIAGSVWAEAFKTGMHGVLCQRSGIALGPPFTPDYKRPRPYYPGDGVKFYQTDINISDGQEGPRGDALVRLWKKNGSLQEVKGVWGGYQDAGDWDTYTTTLGTADLLTELFDICPDYYKQLKLSLPPEEAGNGIPSLLNEALWGLAAFKRLQLPSGAVRDGYGDGWGCREGDVSWNDSNPVCVYAPSRATTFSYAGIAARMARLLAPYDAAQAKAYADSAALAWKWAESEVAKDEKAKPPTDADRKNAGWQYAHGDEAMAAVALYWLTRDNAYHERFRQITELQVPKDTSYSGGWIEPVQQPDASFLYARLPDDLADPVLKETAKKRFVLAGNVAVHFMKGNSLDLATGNSGMPMFDFVPYFTNPGMGNLIVRAHALTGDQRYLETIVASTGFGAGANPDNTAFTTGVGPNPVRFPLKLDSRRTGQPAPIGITVYGPSNQGDPKGSASSSWVHQWILQPDRMTPGSREWPPPESYCDIFGWPAADEFCVNSPMASTAYVWGYLAARR